MKVTLVVAALAAAVSAVTPPNYSLPPSGNPIGTPGAHEQVPVDKPYTITWQPTTESHVSIMLLHGCPKNCNPVQTLAENIPNSGSLSWTPSSDLTGDDSYGLVIVVEGTGQYQYSTNFGIENHSPKPQPPKSTTPAEKPTWTPQPSKPVTHIVETSSSTPVPSGGVITLTTSICPPSATTSTVPGVPQPTGSAPVPGTPHPTGGNPGPAPAPSGSGAPVPPPASTNTPPPFNNGAGRVGAGFGAALLVVAAAFAM